MVSNMHMQARESTIDDSHCGANRAHEYCILCARILRAVKQSRRRGIFGTAVSLFCKDAFACMDKEEENSGPAQA